MKSETVEESPARSDAVIDYEHEHRFAEHEHELLRCQNNQGVRPTGRKTKKPRFSPRGAAGSRARLPMPPLRG